MKNAIAAVDQSGAFEEGSQASPALLVAERRTVAFAVFGYAPKAQNRKAYGEALGLEKENGQR